MILNGLPGYGGGGGGGCLHRQHSLCGELSIPPHSQLHVHTQFGLHVCAHHCASAADASTQPQMTRSDSMLSRLLSLSVRGAALTALWSLLVELHFAAWRSTGTGLRTSPGLSSRSGRSIGGGPLHVAAPGGPDDIIRRLAPFSNFAWPDLDVAYVLCRCFASSAT